MILKPIKFTNHLELKDLESWLKENIHPYIIVEYIDDFVNIELYSDSSMRIIMEKALYNFPSDVWDTKYNARCISLNENNGVWTYTIYQNEMGFEYHKKNKVYY